MMINNQLNAAHRHSFSGNLFNTGIERIKKDIIDSIPSEYSELHLRGSIHIHDLEGYGYTYNCLTPDIMNSFPFEKYENESNMRKITGILEYYKYVITNLANEQTGGIGFANFDKEINYFCNKLNIAYNDTNLSILQCNIQNLIDWINTTRTRNGQECYYISLNLGLCTSKFGRFITKTILEYLIKSPSYYIRPNIIFKLKSGINLNENDFNNDLYLLAVKCTAIKMIPTYLLGDSMSNSKYPIDDIAIMGCRTRVIQNEYGNCTSIGRGNIAYITINLPRIALEIEERYGRKSIEDKMLLLKSEWDIIANMTKEILLDRYNRFMSHNGDHIAFNLAEDLWIKSFKESVNIADVFKHGTFSLGFIGLSEAMEIITGAKYYSSEHNYTMASGFVEHMRQVIDLFRKETKMNFTLLATSGEYISGRFVTLDKEKYTHRVMEKGYYTNSFHVDVDAVMHPFHKLQYEGIFHQMCNGGCISYIELKSAPLVNIEAITELIAKAIESGVSYLGINYPLDICRDCEEVGTFDECSVCNSQNILRFRRVSGYLENLEYFTEGKIAEVNKRSYYRVEE